MRVLVRFMPEERSVSVDPGTTVHEAAAEAGVTIAAPCGGLGRCGSCRVRVTGDVRPPTPREIEALGAAVLRGSRLACSARVQGPGEVMVEHERAGVLRVVTDGPPLRYDVEPPDVRGVECPSAARALGAAVDVGTTTIAVRLHDLSTGAALGDATAENPQTAYGHDVLTRVSRALAGEAEALRHAVAGGIEHLVSSLTDRPAVADGSLCDVVVVGNPTMTHLLLGADVGPLAAAPHDGALTDAVESDAPGADMPGLGPACLYVGPAVSAFVGADTVAAVVATGLAEREGATLLLDLGTNGEAVLASRSGMVAASAAAGPAFEGGGIACGMRAEPGAIERAWFDGTDLCVGTVRDVRALGICGTGLLDITASLLTAGAIDASGRMRAEGPLARLVRETPEGLVFDVADGVTLSQNDVRQVQLAKAAVEVAVEVLLSESGLGYDDVREVLVAGGFGAHLRPASLVALGIIPASWAERVTAVGNAALAGASAMLVSSAARSDAERVARAVRTVPLAERFDFQPRFITALEFPSS